MNICVLVYLVSFATAFTITYQKLEDFNCGKLFIKGSFAASDTTTTAYSWINECEDSVTTSAAVQGFETSLCEYWVVKFKYDSAGPTISGFAGEATAVATFVDTDTAATATIDPETSGSGFPMGTLLA